MKKQTVTILFAALLCANLAAQNLPKKTIALNMSAVRTPAMTIHANPSAGTPRLVPRPGLGYEGQFQAKVRVLPHWYAVGALGSGGFSHSYELEEAGSFRYNRFRYHEIATFHLSASLGMEYHHRLTSRLTVLAGVHTQNNYFIRQALGVSVFHNDSNGMSSPLYRVRYPMGNTSALGIRANVGVQWELGEHIILGAGVSAMSSNFDILKGSTFRLFEDGTPVQEGTLSQRYRYRSADLVVGYRFD